MLDHPGESETNTESHRGTIEERSRIHRHLGPPFAMIAALLAGIGFLWHDGVERTNALLSSASRSCAILSGLDRFQADLRHAESLRSSDEPAARAALEEVDRNLDALRSLTGDGHPGYGRVEAMSAMVHAERDRPDAPAWSNRFLDSVHAAIRPLGELERTSLERNAAEAMWQVRKTGLMLGLGLLTMALSLILAYEMASRRLLRKVLELSLDNGRLAELVAIDGLTGLKNRRHLEEILESAYSAAIRDRRPLSVAMVDLDHFKAYNDSFGHQAGDLIIRTVADILRDGARAHDVVARYGGEEFLLILPATDSHSARAVAERVRLAIASHRWPERPVTASLGLATLPGASPTGVAGLVAEADIALYHSKRRGRDRTTHWADLSGERSRPCPESASTAIPAETIDGTIRARPYPLMIPGG